MRRSGFLLVLLLVLHLSPASAADNSGPLQHDSSPPLALNSLGEDTLPIEGAWQFQPGDDPSWAAPAYNDSKWASIETGRTWEEQGYRNLTGFAWYRRHLVSSEENSRNIPLALFLTDVDSACDVYWNGVLVGSLGRVPPHPVWYWPQSRPSRVIALGPAQSGVLAIRVWKAPYVFYSFPNEGGLIGVPRIGSAQAAANLQAARQLEWLQSRLLDITEVRIAALAGLIAFLFWMRDRSRTVLLWLAIAMEIRIAGFELLDRQGHVPFQVAYGFWGLVIQLNNAAVWLLLIALLGLENRRTLVKWTKIFITVELAMGSWGCIISLLDWTPHHARFFLANDISTGIPSFLIEFWGVVLVLAALRQRLDAARWALAITAMSGALVQSIDDVTTNGMRWTHWTGIERVIDGPLFSVAGNDFTIRDIVTPLFLVSILYVAWRYIAEQNQRKNAIESELRNARAVQQVLVPREIPEVPGFRIDSIYHPAGEVGGDFFQILPTANGGVLIVIGDVSGKGMPAAMTVSLLVGTVRTLAHYTQSPGEILTAMNQRMLARSQGGFTTCLVLRLDANGKLTVANAGHLAPYINGSESELENGLPLGLAPSSVYAETSIPLRPGARLTLVTDGVVEAQNAGGELFGFERTSIISTKTAEEIADAAQRFGQEDDITVLTVSFVPIEVAHA